MSFGTSSHKSNLSPLVINDIGLPFQFETETENSNLYNYYQTLFTTNCMCDSMHFCLLNVIIVI